MITVAMNGKKLFEWEGKVAEVANIDQEVAKIAKAAEAPPENLWQSAVMYISEKGGRFSTGNEAAEMLILTWGVLTMPTRHPDHPGVYGDYLEAWDFDFDIRLDPAAKRINVDIRGGFNSGTPN